MIHLSLILQKPTFGTAESWSVEPSVGTMLIFPSSVEHLVQPYEGDEPRISLSFNTFVRGTLCQNKLMRLEV